MRGKLKSLLPLTLAVITVLSLAVISTTATDGATVYVDPASITCVAPGSTFSVDVAIADVINLYGFDFKLGYDTSVLTATAVTLTGNIFEPGYFVWKSEIDDGLGRVWLAVTQELGATGGVSGSGLMATITFMADDRGASSLDLYEVELRDPQNVIIPHAETDGAFHNVDVSVDPRFIWNPSLGVGSTFDVDIAAIEVTNLYGFDFKLGYDTSVLTATAVALTGNIFEPGYFVWKSEIDDGLGRVWLAVTQELGATGGVSGSGLMATITFTVDDIGTSSLDLYDVELRDPQSILLPICFVQDGYFANAAPILWTKIKTKNPYPDWHLGSVGEWETLYAPVKNTGDIGAFVKAEFVLRKTDMEPIVLWSEEAPVAPGSVVTLSTDPFTFEFSGTYHFSVILWFRITDAEYLDPEPYYLYEDLLGGAGISKETVNRINVKA